MMNVSVWWRHGRGSPSILPRVIREIARRSRRRLLLREFEAKIDLPVDRRCDAGVDSGDVGIGANDSTFLVLDLESTNTYR